MYDFDRRTLLTAGLVTAGAAMATAGTAGTADAQASMGGPPDPVRFWSGVSLELNALDHSVSPGDARAPGPCASSRALGLAHAVIADAVRAAYGAPWRHVFKEYVGIPIMGKEAFVGGAAAAILDHIFTAPAHRILTSARRAEFLRALPDGDRPAWQAGHSFGSSTDFTDHWHWSDISSKILPPLSDYVPRPREHSVDPFNTDQLFYGQKYGSQAGLVLDSGKVDDIVNNYDPPGPTDQEYLDDLDEVRVHGEFPANYDSDNLTDEQQIGLFWAYDGPRLLGTPPRLYNQILWQIAETDKLDAVDAARLFAICNLAMAEAGIVAWKAKYKHCIWRPVLGVQHAYAQWARWRPLGAPRTNPPLPNQPLSVQALLGGGFTGVAAEELGLFAAFEATVVPNKGGSFTPNFPAYPSGHATFGSACFNALRRFRRERFEAGGSADPDVDANDISDVGQFTSDELDGIAVDPNTGKARPWLPRTYPTIDEMIEANNRSRVYLGVHWNFDATHGAGMGSQVAEMVFNTALRPI